MIINRDDGRAWNQVRPLKLTYDPFGYADASLLFELGNTKIMVSISLQDKVPKFLKGGGNGWLTAEYAMLPSATKTRTRRESSLGQRNSRSVEISRLIGRCLRCVVNLDGFGERTIVVDCDVLQADGGTRVASITAASLLLEVAQQRWMQAGIIKKNIVRQQLAAISVGILRSHVYLDLAQNEDSSADADFNFVLTKSGDVVEVQGTSEQKPTSWENFELLKKTALSGVEQLFTMSSFIALPSQKIVKRSEDQSNHQTTS